MNDTIGIPAYAIRIDDEQSLATGRGVAGLRAAARAANGQGDVAVERIDGDETVVIAFRSADEGWWFTAECDNIETLVIAPYARPANLGGSYVVVSPTSRHEFGATAEAFGRAADAAEFLGGSIICRKSAAGTLRVIASSVAGLWWSSAAASDAERAALLARPSSAVRAGLVELAATCFGRLALGTAQPAY